MPVLSPKIAFILAPLFIAFSACQKESSEMSTAKSIANSQALYTAEAVTNQHNSVSVTEITFTAIAMIAYCHGEDIRFTGTIENKVKTTISAGGEVHYTRQFTVKGMTGTGVTTGTVYDVVGGAEMFSIKDPVFNANGTLNLGGSLAGSDLVIHRGTLVFVSRTDGSRVVARHDIQKIPGQGIKENRWLCAGE
jgi:hypothetical protein